MAISLDEAIDHFLQAAAIPALLSQSLDKLASAMGARGALLTTPVLSQRMTPYSSGIDESFNAFFEEGWHTQDVRAHRGAEYCRRNNGRIGFFSDTMLFSPEELKRSEYYEGFGRRHDVPWFAATPIHGGANDYIALSFNRRAKEGAFTPDELARLDAMLPALQNAAKLCVFSFEAQSRGMLLSLDLVSKPACLIGSHGEVIASNEAAHRLYGPALNVRKNHLVAARAATQQSLSAALQESLYAPSPSPPPPVVSIEGANGAPLCFAEFISVRGMAQDLFQRAKVLVIFRPAAREGRTLRMTTLRTLYGLSPREAEMALLLANGHDIRKSAAQLKIGEGTARYYVKVIMAKTDTHRQSELVRLLLSLSN